MEGTFTGEELMKQIMMIATLLLMPPVLIFSQTKDEGEKQKFEREVMKAEEEWRAAVAEGDATVLKRLMADDVLYVTARGQLSDKSVIEVMVENPTGNLKYDDVKVRIYGETAVVSAQFTRGANRRVRVSRVWVRRQDQWQVVSAQLTDIAA
jgi:ketosteroid isomerase-like protein